MILKRIGLKRLIVFVFAFLLGIHNFSFPSFGQEGKEVRQSTSREPIVKLEPKYSTVSKTYTYPAYEGEPIIFLAKDMVAPSKIEKIKDKDGVLIKEGEDVTFRITVPREGQYYIDIQYIVDTDRILPVELSMKVNGKIPFYESRRMIFESQWATKEEKSYDRYGNEIVSLPRKIKDWNQKYIMDSSYRHSQPFAIELEKGENTLAFWAVEGEVYFSQLSLNPKPVLPSYIPHPVIGSEEIIIEAEDMTYRNDSSIRPTGEYDIDLSPYSKNERMLNMIDPNSFKKAGQKIQYEFVAPQEGYYNIGLHYRQAIKIDFPVFVDITIDGQIPYDLLEAYPLAYTTSFKNHLLTNPATGENLSVYLSEGTHTIGFTLNIAPLCEVIEGVEEMMEEINALSLEITKLTGSKDDKYRDFELEKYIPGVKESLLYWADEVASLYDSITMYNPKVRKIGAFSTLTIVEQQLRRLAKKPNDLPKRLTEFSQGTSSVFQYLANFIQDINNNNLALDKIYIIQDESSIPDKSNLFAKSASSISRFFISFGQQAYSVDNTNPEHLQVWINRPRQNIEIIQKMVDETFTPNTGIEVDVSLMPDPNKLVLANAAGKAPDVAISVHYVLPHDLAIRGALHDLREFEDFNEVASRFSPGLFVPAMIEDKVYALPETMNFWVLFYRSDILQAMNIPVPDTLEEVKLSLPELQRRGMNFYYPTAATGAFKPFFGTLPLIYQHGGSFYAENVGRTTLNSEASLAGVKELTDLFTIYNMPYDVPNFYQSFRDGTLPMGVSDYFTYNLLINAAPEIANSWNIGPFPGIAGSEGEVERWTTGGGESCIIFNDSLKKQEAWEYLKWWTSKEAQVEFGHTLQATYGKEYMWNTANLEAFKELPWDKEHKETIMKQQEWLVEAPRVPGTYMLERELSNAYNSIILDGVSLRKAIDLAVKRSNRETNRKLEEFGYLKDGKMIRPYPVPTIFSLEGEGIK